MLTERQSLLRRLTDDGTVRMGWAAEVMEAPAPFGGRRVVPDRLRGMLLGLAIGDALGRTTEGMPPDERRARFGEIRDYLPNRYVGNRPIGLPSDDTELAFLTVAHLLEHGRIEPDALAEQFCAQRIFGIGHSTRLFVDSWRRTHDWRVASQPSAGNGALMRIAPVLLPYLATGGPDLWVDTALATTVSHNDRAAIATSIAFVGLLSELLVMDRPPAREWWVETFMARARPIEGDDTQYRPRGGPLMHSPPGP
ncbi:MAG: ADP-ribosylglycohydrolase family protein, partial [Acetobacteraceae bacterium]